MPSEKTGIHSGHRARMRSRFFETGLDGFQPHEIIELLLFCSIPKRDVNPLAHALLEKFGSVNAILSASPEEIAETPGIGLQTGKLLSALNRLTDVYRDSRHSVSHNLATLAAALRFLPESERTTLKRSLTVIFTDRLNRPLSVQSFPGRPNDPAVIRSVLSKSLTLHSHSAIIFCTGYRPLYPLSRVETDSFRPLVSALAGINSFTVDCILLAREHLLSLRREKLLTNQATAVQENLSRWDYWFGPLAVSESETGWYPLSLITSSEQSNPKETRLP